LAGPGDPVSCFPVVVEVPFVVVRNRAAVVGQPLRPIGNSVVKRRDVFDVLVDDGTVVDVDVELNFHNVVGRETGEGPLEQRPARTVVVLDHLEGWSGNAWVGRHLPATRNVGDFRREQVDEGGVVHRDRAETGPGTKRVAEGVTNLDQVAVLGLVQAGGKYRLGVNLGTGVLVNELRSRFRPPPVHTVRVIAVDRVTDDRYVKTGLIARFLVGETDRDVVVGDYHSVDRISGRKVQVRDVDALLGRGEGKGACASQRGIVRGGVFDNGGHRGRRIGRVTGGSNVDLVQIEQRGI